MNSILTAIISGFLGMWINNVFTWKIKNSVDILDSLYKNLRICNILFKELEYIQRERFDLQQLQNIERLTHGVIQHGDSQPRIKELSQQKDNLWVRVENIFGELDHANAILNNEFTVCINKFKDPTVKLFNDSSLSVNTVYIDEYNEGIKLISEVIKARQKITSFSYMLHVLNPFECKAHET